MDVKFYLSLIKFYALAAAYLFIISGSIYALFVPEVSIQFGSLHYSLSGWPKNLICLGTLFIVALIPAYPIILALYRALATGSK